MAASGSGEMCFNFIHHDRDAKWNEKDYLWQNSENMDDVSDDEYVLRLRKKPYRRHTPQQIQQMEEVFKEHPHPDEKQRYRLSKKLGLSPRQVKFWFQNRRTQLKAIQERHANLLLKREIEELREENVKLRETLARSICFCCGERGLDSIKPHDHKEIHRNAYKNAQQWETIFELQEKLPRPIGNCGPPPAVASPSVDLQISLSGMSEINFRDAESRHLPNELVLAVMRLDLSNVAQLALAALQELLRLCQNDEPSWVKGTSQNIVDTLDQEAYFREFTTKPTGFKRIIGHRTEGTRFTDIVGEKSTEIVKALLNEERYIAMFPCQIASATTLEVISDPANGDPSGTMQLMHAELMILSPLFPKRDVCFVRYCKQVDKETWIVADVSIDYLLENPKDRFTCIKLPSGCLLKDMSEGRSKVTWVEHTQYDTSEIPGVFWRYMSDGMPFSAHHWVLALQSKFPQKLFQYYSFKEVSVQDVPDFCSTPGSLVRLAERMASEFCKEVMLLSREKSDVSPFTRAKGDLEVRSAWRKTTAEASSDCVILAAATSLCLPVSPLRLFAFLSDYKNRPKWDVLCNVDEIAEIACVDDGKKSGNSISLLSINKSKSVMLQENSYVNGEWKIVYGAINECADASEKGKFENTILPSGFVIFANGDSEDDMSSSSCVMTIAFQMMLSNSPPSVSSTDIPPSSSPTTEAREAAHYVLTTTASKITSSLFPFYDETKY